MGVCKYCNNSITQKVIEKKRTFGDIYEWILNVKLLQEETEQLSLSKF